MAYLLLPTTAAAQIYRINTIAGSGTKGFGGDGHAAVSAKLSNPNGVAQDSTGNLYITDEINNRIRMVNKGGIITTFAGNGTAGFAGDGHMADSAVFNAPCAIAINSAGTIYIADKQNQRIRVITKNGIISTFAGNGTAGFAGDGHAADSAELNYPTGVAVDNSGNVYIADQDNHRIRKVNTSGIISTFAGTGTAGFAGDGGAADSAELNYPAGVGVDNLGNVYIADVVNNRIRMVNAHDTITTFAGKGIQGFGGDKHGADSAELSLPYAVTADGSGSVYIADQGNNRIRMVTKDVIHTIAGNGIQGYSGDGHPADSAKLFNPSGIAVDDSGNVFVADAGNSRIRKLTLLAPTISQANTILSSSFAIGNRWYLNGTAIANATGKSDTIRASGVYTVKVVSVVDTLVSAPVLIQLPATPTITVLGRVLKSSSATHNQWYLDGVALPHDTLQTDTARAIGTYTVKVTITGVTSAPAVAAIIKTVGIDYYTADNTLVVYPNPGTGIFNIKAEEVMLTIEVLTATGQPFLVHPVDASTAIIDLSNQPKGMYFYKITGYSGSVGTGKIIVE